MLYAPQSGRSSMVERELPKLYTRVRFPSPAPNKHFSTSTQVHKSHQLQVLALILVISTSTFIYRNLYIYVYSNAYSPRSTLWNYTQCHLQTLKSGALSHVRSPIHLMMVAACLYSLSRTDQRGGVSGTVSTESQKCCHLVHILIFL